MIARIHVWWNMSSAAELSPKSKRYRNSSEAVKRTNPRRDQIDASLFETSFQNMQGLEVCVQASGEAAESDGFATFT